MRVLGAMRVSHSRYVVPCVLRPFEYSSSAIRLFPFRPGMKCRCYFRAVGSVLRSCRVENPGSDDHLTPLFTERLQNGKPT